MAGRLPQSHQDAFFFQEHDLTHISLTRSETASRRFTLLLLKLNPGMVVPQQLLSQHGNKHVQQALHQTATEFSGNIKSKCHYQTVRFSYNPSFSACFFSRNSVFLSQQISRNSVSICFFSEANGANYFDQKL